MAAIEGRPSEPVVWFLHIPSAQSEDRSETCLVFSLSEWAGKTVKDLVLKAQAMDPQKTCHLDEQIRLRFEGDHRTIQYTADIPLNIVSKRILKEGHWPEDEDSWPQLCGVLSRASEMQEKSPSPSLEEDCTSPLLERQLSSLETNPAGPLPETTPDPHSLPGSSEPPGSNAHPQLNETLPQSSETPASNANAQLDGKENGGNASQLDTSKEESLQKASEPARLNTNPQLNQTENGGNASEMITTKEDGLGSARGKLPINRKRKAKSGEVQKKLKMMPMQQESDVIVLDAADEMKGRKKGGADSRRESREWGPTGVWLWGVEKRKEESKSGGDNGASEKLRVEKRVSSRVRPPQGTYLAASKGVSLPSPLPMESPTTSKSSRLNEVLTNVLDGLGFGEGKNQVGEDDEGRGAGRLSNPNPNPNSNPNPYPNPKGKKQRDKKTDLREAIVGEELVGRWGRRTWPMTGGVCRGFNGRVTKGPTKAAKVTDKCYTFVYKLQDSTRRKGCDKEKLDQRQVLAAVALYEKALAEGQCEREDSENEESMLGGTIVGVNIGGS